VALAEDLTIYRQRLDQQLTQRLNHSSIQDSLQQAMRYSIFNGGKRIRPALIYMVNQSLGGDIENADAAACAIEAIHSYSLVHDDLPAMDDDDLRRGKPTCHIEFDHATAILAGDALQCIGFEWLADQQNSLGSTTALAMLKVLTKASGDSGMVAGQAFDLANVGCELIVEQLESMHKHKTGALINGAIELGILSANRNISEQQHAAFQRYGAAIGLAFQVQDDILDLTSDTLTLGKPQGSDIDANKPTYPSLLGLPGARDKLQQLYQQAIQATDVLGPNAHILSELAQYIVERDH